MNNKANLVIQVIISILLLIVIVELGMIINIKRKAAYENQMPVQSTIQENKAQIEAVLDEEGEQGNDETTEFDSVRDIVANKEDYYNQEVLIGPVKVLKNNIDAQTFWTRPALGNDKYDYDRDVGVDIIYGGVSDIDEWRHLKSGEYPEIYTKGIVGQYYKTSNMYIRAYAIDYTYEGLIAKLAELEGNADEGAGENVAQNEDAKNILPVNVASKAEDETEIQYKMYHNARYLFSIEYPDIFTEEEYPDNGDGIIMRNPETETQLIISGGNNILDETAKSQYEEATATLTNMMYHLQTDNWYVLAWEEEGIVHYRKSIVGAGSQNTFHISYPNKEKVRYDEIITHLNDTFDTPGIQEFH